MPMEEFKLELHYFLDDGSHSIDSFIRNKCEAEILLIAKDLIIEMGGDVSIFTEIPTEGGFIELWKLVKKPQSQLAIFLVAVQVAVSFMTKTPTNERKEGLDTYNSYVDSVENSIKLRELLKKIEAENFIVKDTADLIEECVNHFNHEIKLVKRRSNFYHHLQGYHDVSKISTTTYLDDKVSGKESVVERKDFHKFILTTNELKPLPVPNAIIEVISPVLKNETYKWRGVYEGAPISFNMKDTSYKNSIIKGQTIFRSGLYIECVMDIKRRVNDTGIVENYDYSVTTVLGEVTDGKTILNEQGKRYLRNKKDNDNQGKLF